MTVCELHIIMWKGPFFEWMSEWLLFNANLSTITLRVFSLKFVSDVPADQPTWLPLLKVEHRGKINNKIQLKNPEKWSEGAIASKFIEMIHLWSPLRIMVDDLNRHQTWPPPLLKKENLTKISIEKSWKRSIAFRLQENDTSVITFQNYGW